MNQTETRLVPLPTRIALALKAGELDPRTLPLDTRRLLYDFPFAEPTEEVIQEGKRTT